MVEVVLGTYRPAPGTRPEDLQIPGAGIYEADFNVPDWLIPDFSAERKFDVQRGGLRYTHERTTVKGTVLTIRFSVERTAPPPPPDFPVDEAGLGPVVKVILGAVLSVVATYFVQAIVDALREVRKLGETTAGKIGIVGAGALALGLGYFLVKRG